MATAAWGAARVQALEQASGPALTKIVGEGAAGFPPAAIENRIAVQTDGPPPPGRLLRVEPLKSAFRALAQNSTRKRSAGFGQPRRNGIAV